MTTTTHHDQLTARDVYQIEDMVAQVVCAGGDFDFHGSRLWLDNCKITTYTPDQQPLLQGITAGLYGKHRAPGRPDAAPALRISRQAYRRAWYSNSKHEIVLPNQRWSLSSMVLAHEVAHACAGVGHDQRSSHGKPWRKMYAAVVSDLIGPEAGLLLLDALNV